MVKQSFSSDTDQHDPKVFRESLGTLGTTTQPGANQLAELQTKIRQGVKHVELHLANRDKGNFGAQDVPDKYGFEQRRTIMQLAKLNNQTLSVHGSFDITSFSGLGQNGFDESQRWGNMKEIDETLKFAAETAKGGAVVFHIQGDGINSSKDELSLSKKYLDWLKEKRPQEYYKIKKEYLSPNPLDRTFVNNPEQEKEVKASFKDISKKDQEKYIKKAKQTGRNPWEEYFIEKNIEKAKLSPDMSPLTVTGDKITQVKRSNEVVNVSVLKNPKGLSDKEKDILKKVGIDLSHDLSLEEIQKANGIFTNGLPERLKSEVNEETFDNLKNKLMLRYENFLEKNDYLQSQADKEFQEKTIENQIELAKIQKEDLESNYTFYKGYLEELKQIKEKQKKLFSEQKHVNSEEEKKRLNSELNKLNRRKQELQLYEIGQMEYQKLDSYDESVAQLNEQIRELESQRGNIKSLSDEVFDKNSNAMGHLGLKALRYQLDLKQKSKEAEKEVAKINHKVKELQEKIENTSDDNEKNKIRDQMLKEKYKLKQWRGVRDYEDIDLVNRPLYLAPENMLPGMGSLTSLEEYKGSIRMSQEDFAKKLLSNEEDYKKIREEYEKETGIKIKTHDDALKVAKKHISGTFDNAHAGVWLKHFKRKPGESEEHRIDRFNKWLNTEAEKMFDEGIVKHVHLNDTQAKHDDHNLIGQGILDVHDLKDRLRKKGFNEAFIVEAGGRGADQIMHLHNAFDIFMPSLFADSNSEAGLGYKLPQEGSFKGGEEVSDWMEVKRLYNNRPEFSQYGMGYSSFRHQGPPQGSPRGTWSGTGFL